MIETAARLFRRRGYDGVGVALILQESGAPRGSLYHHFPGGKAEIAAEAAGWARDRMLEVIDAAFDPAPTAEEGRAHFVAKIARLFEASDCRDACPVSVYLHAAPTEGADDVSRLVAEVYAAWTARVADHLARLGLSEPHAVAEARDLLIRLQGAWIVARAERRGDAIRQIMRPMMRPDAVAVQSSGKA